MTYSTSIADVSRLTSAAVREHIANRYPSRVGIHEPAALAAAARDVSRRLGNYKPAEVLAFIFGERQWLGSACSGLAGSGENSRASAAIYDLFAESYAKHA